MILIVDDHQDTREMLANILQWEQLESVGVESGQKALEYLRSSTPSLIVLDYNMPEMDGLEMLGRVKADSRLSSIPVVIFSAYGDEIKEKAMKAGASGYVQKGSLDWLLLGSLIRRVLHREVYVRPTGVAAVETKELTRDAHQ